MKIKTFYAKTMAQALQDIKTELGPDALILATKEIRRRSGAGFQEKSVFEVVAATDDQQDSELTPAGSAPARDDRKSAAGHPRSAVEPVIYAADGRTRIQNYGEKGSTTKVERNEIRREIRSPRRLDAQSESLFENVAVYDLYQDLVANEVNEWLAYKLLDEAQVLGPDNTRDRRALLRSVTEVARGLVAGSCSADGLPAKRVVAFVGPTGVGKTTAIAKLAARLALEKRKKVVLMTLDSFRIGAVEQLKTYASLMALPFRAVSQVSELPQAIQDHSQRDYILIDTTGRGPKDIETMQDVINFLQNSNHVERHLVLSATTKSTDMHQIVDRFGSFRPDHFVFTKLDETSTFGPIFNELVRTQKPVSYLTDGQKVPEDFHVLPMKRIIDIVLNAN